MSKNNIDYTIHYKNWHSEENKQNEINYFISLLNSHNFMPSNKDDNILEIGTGMGRLMLALKASGYKNIKGCEIDKGLYEICIKEGLDVYNNDIISYLKNTDEKFDTIYFFDVLEHLPKNEQIELLQLINEHLTENGKVILSVPNAHAPLSHYFENIDWTHYCSFSIFSLSFVLKSANMQFFSLRPSHQESPKIREMKKPWIDLFEEEFGIKEPIMTPSIIACIFKNEDDFNNFKKNAPNLMEFEQFQKNKKSSKQKLLKIISAFIPCKAIRTKIRAL